MTSETDDADHGGSDRSPSADAKRDGERGPPTDGEPPELRIEELSLPQRVFVAAVQNPFRGALIALLFGLAFSFFIALWLAFPRIAAGFSVLTLVVVVLIAGVLRLLR
ncbi:hypothetical protein [Halopenitus persicus]|uniref:hypothetical protein n=1 Tax=Halopenitus persicus TaxID=1048396 RepID=UPI000BBB5E16|nr:hypothetical protein [Halopenitus persicus]